jgi:UDP-N-acetylmuramoyl-tripeptide--D-alanyl-D-alanine ligase
MNRRALKKTKTALAITSYLNLAYLISAFLAVTIFLLLSPILGIVVLLLSPILCALSIIPPIFISQAFQSHISSSIRDKKTREIFSNNPGTKIAVLGSYGKTTVKELLAEVLGAKYKVASTPGNMNTAIAHYRFAKTLKGDEEFIIIEYGEEIPGDIKRYATNTKPDVAVVTGLAPAHMDKLKTIKLAGEELFAISDFVDQKDIYINLESPLLAEFVSEHFGKSNRIRSFSKQDSLGWSTKEIKVNLSGLSFKLQKDKKSILIQSKLIGEHLVGPLSFVAALSNKLGMNENEITEAIKNTKAHKARLEPIRLGQATIINDGYNGNIEGIKAGVKLVKSLKTSGKKTYVTPGLVHQGKDSDIIHKEIARLVASVFDKIYLVSNPQTMVIQEELISLHYKGDIQIVDDPLGFYNSLESFTAKGDIVLIQNDLPDSLAH